ncbi:CRISPR-associated helicase Cas3' [Streptomyces mauvecolor]|uniref:CRISPR-associated helicase Cas3 n=1 Tax=Streptomyces mauvecolor TaxID=58345 RepID=A0ABV9UGF4_9ACTN
MSRNDCHNDTIRRTPPADVSRLSLIWRWIWGKTDLNGISRARGGPAWNPLLAHCLDTAAVTGALFDCYLAANVRARLADAFGGGCAATARRVLMFLAALHDMPGKVQPAMQRRFPDGTDRNDPELTAAGRQWARTIESFGLSLNHWHADVPHAHVTAYYLPGLLGCRCKRCINALPGTPGTPTARHEGLHTLAHLLGGHHGHIPEASRVLRADCALPPIWHDLHAGLRDELARLIGIDLDTLPDLINPQRPAVLVLMAGLVVHSDWIASDESRFTYRTPDTSPDQWWHDAQDQAATAIRELRLTRWDPPPATWRRMLPATPRPRPAQQAVIDAAPTGPVMAVIESNTGSGKTENALWLAHHLARTCGYHGFYLAQANRAASEQQTHRAAEFLATTLGGRRQANLALVHGTASAAAVTQELLDAAAGPATLADLINLTDCDDPQGRAVLDAWFLAHGRGLLSPFGVGTVDQIALAAQRSRHWFLRLYGLANKTVIIDEAHAYALFQQELLGAAISWLADAGASIIILSATLTDTIRQPLIDAWCQGHQTTPTGDTPTGPITFIDTTGHTRSIIPKTTRAPKLRTRLLLTPDPGPQQLAERLLTQHPHGITTIVRNKVEPTAALYQAAIDAAHRHGWRRRDILCLHGRFFERDRARKQARVLRLLGPHPDPQHRSTTRNPHRPDRFLLIGTQVLEQSLDYCADHFYTDLAPWDLVEQRRGRQWRHWLNRPHLRRHTPLLHVLWTPTSDGLPDPSGPYEPYLLAATWHLLNQRMPARSILRLTTPRDTHPLLKALYDLPPETGNDPIHHLLNTLYKLWQKTLAEEQQEARGRILRPFGTDGTPITVADLATGTSHGDPDDPNAPLHLTARSRLGTPTINAVGLYQHPGKPTRTWDSKGTLPADLTPHHTTRQPDERRHQKREILLNTVRIPASWFRGANALPPPHTWTINNPGALKNHPALLLNPDGRPVDPRLADLNYSPYTGLSHTRTDQDMP